MKNIFLCGSTLTVTQRFFSQGSTDYGAGLKFNLNEDGSQIHASDCMEPNLVSFCRDESWNNDWWRAASTATDIKDVCVF
jgi:hypothetical protein